MLSRTQHGKSFYTPGHDKFIDTSLSSLAWTPSSSSVKANVVSFNSRTLDENVSHRCWLRTGLQAKTMKSLKNSWHPGKVGRGQGPPRLRGLMNLSWSLKAEIICCYNFVGTYKLQQKNGHTTSEIILSLKDLPQISEGATQRICSTTKYLNRLFFMMFIVQCPQMAYVQQLFNKICKENADATNIKMSNL